jgi:hypothetical protein
LKSDLSADLTEIIVKDFVSNSGACIQTMVEELARFEKTKIAKTRLFQFRNEHGNETAIDSGHFFVRASVEYSNPQVTLEEVQGIIAARLLEVCGTYFYQYGLHEINETDVDQICETLKKPPKGIAISFLLNTDDVEPDRYSANPLRESIISSGQSAFPSAAVKTDQLTVDQNFLKKYEGVLISKDEAELIARHLETSKKSYVDMVDAIKYEQLENLSKHFGISLCINLIRMPIEILQAESTDGLLHHIISEVHRDFASIEQAYKCMDRSIRNRTTLLTVPHSSKGYGSKRAARGKIYFDGKKLRSVKVDYRTTLLYENEVDAADISVAKAEDSFMVDGNKLANYNFKETPSSPQFSLYSLASPENAAVWHGIGVFGAPGLLKSLMAVRQACAQSLLVPNLEKEYGVLLNVPINFNLIPKFMWGHPVHQNIDSSIGCIQDLKDLANMGMRLEHLSSSSKVGEHVLQANQA